MSRIDNFNIKEAQMNHRRRLKELKGQHSTEVDKLQLKHEKFKNQLNLKNTLEANEIHGQHEIKMAKQSQRNQVLLDRMQKNLDLVKQRNEKEKSNLTKNLQQRKELLKTQHYSMAKAAKDKHQYLMQDLTHQSDIELNRIRKKINQNKSELTNESSKEAKSQEISNKKTLNTDKDVFEKKRLAQTDKFQNTLLKQKKDQDNQMVNERRKSQKVLTNAQKAFQNEFGRLKKDHMQKKKQLSKSHQKDFQKSLRKNEYVLQRLVGKKEAILNRMRQMLKTEAKKEIIKNRDPFYQFTDLNPKHEVNEAGNGYIITMEVPEHEANKVRLSGHNRELKVTMERNFDYKDEGNDGSKDMIKRVESYTSKIPVKHIVDSKSTERSYADGVLTYHIKFA